MKKFMFAAVAATACLISCSDTNDVESPAEDASVRQQLSINPSIGLPTRAVKTGWSEGDRLGVFVCNGSPGNPYEGLASNLNVPFTFDGVRWTSARITLTGNEAAVFACYPYSDAATAAAAMPVESASQTDYLYGEGSSRANYLSRNVDIEMKHALSFVTFRMGKSNYTLGPGSLTRVVISNENGATALKSAGTLNIATGAVTSSTPRNLDLPATVDIQSAGTSFSAIVMPVSPLAGADLLKVTFTIDGEELYHFFRAGTEWKQGYRNIYSFTLSDNGIEIGGGPDGGGGGITIEHWTDDDEGTVNLIPKL
jgi:hypothetical protein